MDFPSRLSEKPTIHQGCLLENTDLGEWTEIGEGNTFENVRFGSWSYTGPYCILQNTVVGRFSNIAAMVRIGPTAHPMDRPTLHHFTYRRRDYGFSDRDDDEFFRKRSERVSEIGHDTWIGHGAVIMPGIALGIGAVVGSGAVVTKNVGPYEVVGGVPARLIKRRFSGIQADRMIQIAWWDWDYQTVRDRQEDFLLTADEFLEKYKL